MKPVLVVLTAASLLFTTTVQAMEIWHFDQMTADDQINFVNQLIDSVENATHPDQLPRVQRFFKAKQPGEAISGMGQFEMNLSLARVADLDSVAKNPKARRLAVEDVMYTTLERNGIALPASFRPALKFQPKVPFAARVLTKQQADKALADTQAWVARTVTAPRTLSATVGPGMFSDPRNGLGFFMALIAIGNQNPNATPGPSTSSNNGTWWEQNGYNSYHDAARAACMSNTTSAHSNC
jgi:hypothetical protein